MFGYLVADAGLMSEAQDARYRACYCGLCRSLKARHGQIPRLTLNYDMTFLVLLLSSMYEEPEQSGNGTCIAHPRQARDWWMNDATGYAADMNVALAYLKCMDDWDDDANPIALAEAGLLKKAYKGICESYPRQCSAMEKGIADLRAIEKSGEDRPDAAAECFGYLMGELLVYKDDRWAATLRALGNALGRFIYVMDACMDLDSDTFRNSYNPFRRYYGLLDNEQRFRDILKMILGECLMEFDRLPLVQDVQLMQNILCAGLWAQFNKKYSNKKGPVDESGPV